MIIFPGGERLKWNFRRGGWGGGGLSWELILENPEGGRGYTKNPFRGGYGYFLEPHISKKRQEIRGGSRTV